jgi:hypothetical protein
MLIEDRKLKAFLVVSFVVFLLFLTISQTLGMHLGEYEVFFNYSVKMAALYDTHVIIASSDNFLSYPILVFFQKIFYSFSVYGLVKLLFIYISTVIIIYSIYENNYFSTFYSFLIIFLFILLFFENFILIQNIRVSTMLSLSAFIFLLTFKNKSKKQVVVFYILAILSITNRIEITMLFNALFLVIAIISREKQIIRHSAYFMGITILSFITFLTLANLNFDQSKDWVKYERDFYDKENFIIKGSPFDEAIDQESVKYFAKALFLRDDSQLNQIPYSSMILYPSLIDYVFKNPEFKHIYFSKFQDSFSEAASNYLPLILLFTLVWILLLLFQLNLFLRYSLLLGMLLAIFCLINLTAVIYLDVSHSFLVFIIFIMIFLVGQKISKKSLFFITLISIILTCSQLFLYSFKSFKNLKQSNLNYQQIQTAFEDDQKLNRLSIISYLSYQETIPSDIFTNQNFLLNQIAFLDYGGINNLPLFANINSKLFGDAHTSLPKKMKWVVEHNDGYIYSNTFFKDFYIQYLDKVHHLSIDFELVEEFENIELKKYRVEFISIPESHSINN